MTIHLRPRTSLKRLCIEGETSLFPYYSLISTCSLLIYIESSRYPVLKKFTVNFSKPTSALSRISYFIESSPSSLFSLQRNIAKFQVKTFTIVPHPDNISQEPADRHRPPDAHHSYCRNRRQDISQDDTGSQRNDR